MPTYLDLGVVRIQEYINRTAGSDEHVLRKRRGASRAVALATSPAWFTTLGAEPNPETYNTEGVAHLILVDPADDATPAQVEQVAAEALAMMRRALPNAYLEASWGTGSCYQDVAPRMAQARNGTIDDPAVGAVSWIPATRDDPIARRCGSCGTGIANTGSDCPDCRNREHQGVRGAKGRPADCGPRADRQDTAEERTIGALAELGLIRTPVPDLKSLAGLPGGDREKRNHVATVYADGNNVGALFRALKSDQTTAIEVSRVLDRAIKQAGTAALARLAELGGPEITSLAGVVTTLAADDVLITVPATWGWEFVVEVVTEFNRLAGIGIAELNGDRGPRAQLTVPTLTAGIVFSHCKSPIEVAITAADQVMRAAKRSVQGRESAIGWLDLTQTSQPGGSPSRPIDWFIRNERTLTTFAGIPSSQRAKIARDIAAVRGVVSDTELAAYLHAEAARLGYPDAVKPLGDDLSDWQACLLIARWWQGREDQS